MCVYFSEREDRPNQQEEEKKRGFCYDCLSSLSLSPHLYIFLISIARQFLSFVDLILFCRFVIEKLSLLYQRRAGDTRPDRLKGAVMRTPAVRAGHSGIATITPPSLSRWWWKRLCASFCFQFFYSVVVFSRFFFSFSLSFHPSWGPSWFRKGESIFF